MLKETTRPRGADQIADWLVKYLPLDIHLANLESPIRPSMPEQAGEFYQLLVQRVTAKNQQRGMDDSPSVAWFLMPNNNKSVVSVENVPPDTDLLEADHRMRQSFASARAADRLLGLITLEEEQQIVLSYNPNVTVAAAKIVVNYGTISEREYLLFKHVVNEDVQHALVESDIPWSMPKGIADGHLVSMDDLTMLHQSFSQAAFYSNKFLPSFAT